MRPEEFPSEYSACVRDSKVLVDSISQLRWESVQARRGHCSGKVGGGDARGNAMVGRKARLRWESATYKQRISGRVPVNGAIAFPSVTNYKAVSGQMLLGLGKDEIVASIAHTGAHTWFVDASDSIGTGSNPRQMGLYEYQRWPPV